MLVFTWMTTWLFGIGAAAHGSACCTFPTFEKPIASYLEAPRKFGASRANGRAHAACDLYQSKPGQGVRSVEDGTVLRDKYYFYQGTYAIEVKHSPGFVVRYGEVNGRSAPGVRKNAKIQRGGLLGYVGLVNSGCCAPMLHFEKYRGDISGPLTQTGLRPFQRRRDLMDPTAHLVAWERTTFPPISAPTALQALLPSLPSGVNEIYLDHQNSFAELIQVLRDFGLGEKSDRELVEALSRLQLQPTESLDSNPYTGVMKVVQTTAEDRGAQHVHAQFFGDSEKDLSLQHISFETQSGALQIADLSQILTQQFPLLGSPEIQSVDFIRWRLPNEKILWVKQLAQEELVEHPYFSYAARDVGSLRIAIEVDPE